MDKRYRITYRTSTGHRGTAQIWARNARAARAGFAYADFGWTIASVRVVR